MQQLTMGAAREAQTESMPAHTVRQWLREPLLHFALIGSLLFALDHFLVSRTDDPHVIVMDQAVEDEARRVFAAARGREPDADELRALRQVWLDNEILYREGLVLQVDRGDTAIRERVIFKALSLIDAGVKLPAIDDQTLRAWFEKRRDKYDEPARFDFEEAALAGTPTESDIRQFVADLDHGVPGDSRAGLRVFKGRPQSNILQSYGEEFATALAGLPVGQWHSLQSKTSWHAVRLIGYAATQPADYDLVRGPVLQDWKDAVASEQRTAAVRALASKYQIVSASRE
ncbi:MAG: peptidylprolyl isomerase [Steroidobacteraceae bacterium]